MSKYPVQGVMTYPCEDRYIISIARWRDNEVKWRNYVYPYDKKDIFKVLQRAQLLYIMCQVALVLKRMSEYRVTLEYERARLLAEMESKIELMR